MRDGAARFTSAEPSDQIDHRKANGSAGGRPPAFNEDEHRHRDVIERCFARLKQSRDFVNRHTQRAAYDAAELIIATSLLWLR